MTAFTYFKDQWTPIIDDYLAKHLASEVKDQKISQIMAYSVMAGGKRLRPLLFLATLNTLGKKIEEPEVRIACGIELIHTYSLIHDDLPAMDDDDLRRGKPSCHKAYGEAFAILAGDGLLTRAFDVVLESDASSDQKVQLVHLLSDYAGVYGMVYGQELDLLAEDDTAMTIDKVFAIDAYKTAKLLTLPLLCGATLADKEKDYPHWEKIGYDLGIQFQIQDDILDQTQSSQALGKSTSDQENHKQTFVSLLGLEKAKAEVVRFEKEIQSELEYFQGDTSYLKSLIRFMVYRTY